MGRQFRSRRPASSSEKIFRFLPTHAICVRPQQVQPILIGPITDLLTFYADVQPAMRQKNPFELETTSM